MKRKQTINDLIVLEELFLDQTRSKFHSVFSILKLRTKKEGEIAEKLDVLEDLTIDNLERLVKIKKV